MTDRVFSRSGLFDSIERLSEASATAMVSRARTSSRALNAVLRRRLSAPPGGRDSLFADPALEIAREWRPAPATFGELAGGLLNPALVDALAAAGEHAMPRDRHPYLHQHRAWEASLTGERSVLVSSGTGSGKTECFLIPILNDLLERTRPGGGVQAILLYPLNALIESQRERLNAWASGLGGRVRFALYNGDTEETERRARIKSTKVELRSRETIRACPPEILVTNVTMLEYLLLRGKDRAILKASEGALRWIVLDEAHSYIGSQAAEMALLLRRVRSAFKVQASDVRLMATSATIAGESDATEKLRDFLAALAGCPSDQAQVIEGAAVETVLPAPGPDIPLDAVLKASDQDALGLALACHPKVQKLRAALDQGAVTLRGAAQLLFDDANRVRDAQRVLDAAAEARFSGKRLMPWRAHLFERALGGIWACIDPDCPERDPECCVEGADWPFGAIATVHRDSCDCGAPMFEMVSCTECGTPHLAIGVSGGASPSLVRLPNETVDEFSIDVEPEERAEDEEGESSIETGSKHWLAPPRDALFANWIGVDTGLVYDNAAPEGVRSVRMRLIRDVDDRACCVGAADARLAPMRFGPAFLMGGATPDLLEAFAPPANEPGLPAAGRRAISFSDSRQGVARLAARLQQESERAMVRSFLYHAVQEQGSQADPAEIAKTQNRLEKYLRDPEDWQDEIEETRAKLTRLEGAAATPVSWLDLRAGLAAHEDLRSFIMNVWKDRTIMREGVEERPEELAEMLLLRELLRRPKVQNNPETMGLVRLAFPKLEKKALGMNPPQPLIDVGMGREDWRGLALAAVDLGFRANLAVRADDWMTPFIAPRNGSLNSVAPPRTAKAERSASARGWPSGRTGRARLTKLIYALIRGEPGDPLAEDRADMVLDALWTLISSTVAVDVGRGEMRLNFTDAAVARVDEAWICLVTRRPFGYAIGGRSPFAPDRQMEKVSWPVLPTANRGGLSSAAAREIKQWTREDSKVATLRQAGIWTDLNDRIAAYPRYIRAQEHSAQIPRPVLKRYEDAFSAGKINMLNCSTTMEMGVDIPNVRLVMNSNVPPALSNYRQRVGRAGRRGEPWAFGVTFCRDLPLDRRAFASPKAFLAHSIIAPRVLLDAPAQISRHVNALLLAAWLAEKTEGLQLQETVGAFLGADETIDGATDRQAPIDAFISDLRGDWGREPKIASRIEALLFGTILHTERPSMRCDATGEAADRFARRWRNEHRALLERGAVLDDPDAARSLELRAKRMRGEFLLAELARRGFTPSYGFPTDVVAFDHRAGARGEENDAAPRFGFRALGASRSLDVAIREYAPGAEVMIDGLVHMSEGVRPAWSAGADASRLEDLRALWRCGGCDATGLTPDAPVDCPACGERVTNIRRTLRPVGFLGRKRPHSGYEMLAHTPYQRPEISADGADWHALPDAEAGRFRAAPEGHVYSISSGREEGGFAICLDCGRAEAMPRPDQSFETPLPEAIRRHTPLAPVKERTRDGLCPASDRPFRIQRHVHLVHDARTDVFELQLPHGVRKDSGLAFAASLREALADMLGVEAREIGVALADSRGAAGEARLSACLFDRASGGAGYSTRLADGDAFGLAVQTAVKRLECPEACEAGCPACILRPDLNQREVEMDRLGGLVLAEAIARQIRIPEDLCVFGAGTTLLGRNLPDWLEDEERAGRIDTLTLYLHGSPGAWDIEGAGFGPMTRRLRDRVRIAISKHALSEAGWSHGVALALIGLGSKAALVAAAPTLGGRPLLAVVRRPDGSLLGIASSNDKDAAPGPDWGRGADSPVLRGVMKQAPRMQLVAMEAVAKLSAGNGWFVEVGPKLDGPLKGFGGRFWKLLAGKAPFLVAAMQTSGVKTLRYCDRYLLSPAALGMLAETVSSCPGLRDGAITIDIAGGDGNARAHWRIQDNFPSDGMRTQTLRSLLQSASVQLHSDRRDLDHYRSFKLLLRDDREVTIYLDQGFGAWQINGSPRHDFGASADRQAEAIRTTEVDVKAFSETGSPVYVTMSDPQA